MQKRLSAYWWCQIVGWGTYLLISTLFYLSLPDFIWNFLPPLFLATIAGIFISHTMRMFIIKARILQLNTLRQIICILITTAVFSFILALITIWVAGALQWGNDLIRLYHIGNKTRVLLMLSYSNCIVLFMWNLIYFSYHYIKKGRKEQIEKIRFEDELKIQKLESEMTKAELRQQSTEHEIKVVVANQEDERKRISRDLHDDVGTKLSALKYFLSLLHEKASDTNNDEIKSLARSSEQFIAEAMQDVRQLLLNLSPAVLEEFGYTTAVEGLVNKINETKQINFNLVVFGMKQRLQKDYELALYRITQELINNVLKHAEAKHVSLQIGQRDEKIILMIEDDGKGFDLNAHKDGYGLHNLDARTRLLQGTMVIESKPGKGTSVLIEIPYNF